MVITFLAFLLIFCRSSVVLSIVLAPYLNNDTAHVLIALILFLPCKFYFIISFSLRIYSALNYTFISCSLTLSSSITPRYIYPYSLTSVIIFPLRFSRFFDIVVFYFYRFFFLRERFQIIRPACLEMQREGKK